MIEYLTLKIEEMRNEMETKIDNLQETVNSLTTIMKTFIETQQRGQVVENEVKKDFIDSED